jgi:hypothetical protein
VNARFFALSVACRKIAIVQKMIAGSDWANIPCVVEGWVIHA